MHSRTEVEVVQLRENGTWLGSPVTRLTGPLSAITAELPAFVRRPFIIGNPQGAAAGENPNFDVVVRTPTSSDAREVPVGVVSKSYTLIQHRELCESSSAALTANGIDPRSVAATADVTEFGERIELALTLPEAFQRDPGDGHPIGLQVRCINSVDGSTRLMAVVGWLRFVCSNGMVVGTATSRIRQVHNAGLSLDDISEVVRCGLADAKSDLERFQQWSAIELPESRITHWVDADAKRVWGVKAATRVFHIVNRGMDVRFAKPFEAAAPSAKTVEIVGPVPGALPGRRDAYSVSQALAWLARDRRELQERTEWMLQIPHLMSRLLSR